MTDLKPQGIDVSWSDSLPAALRWIQKVKISATANSGKAPFVLVPVEGKDGDIQLPTAGLSDGQSSWLKANLSKLSWAGKGTLILQDNSQTYLVVGISKVKTQPIQKARQVGLDACAALSNLKVGSLGILGRDQIASHDILDGYLQGLYSAGGFRKVSVEIPVNWPEAIEVMGEDSKSIDSISNLTRGLYYARHVQDAPSNWLTPERFAQIAVDLGQVHGFKVKVLDRSQILAEGMHSMAGVAAGSCNDPRLIVMEMDGIDNSKTTALIGKGLTFDSGGISIKPSDGMDEMKYDMSGGAAVLGAMVALSQSKPTTKIVALIGAVENMPSHASMKPGDILRSMSGKTIEVLNTDAEGRLVLVDVIEYAKKYYQPTLMVDLATLTGAVLVALGKSGAGVMSNQDNVAEQFVKIARAQGEPCWILPMWPELDSEVTSEIADYKNIVSSSVKAGTISAGVFLREFVGETPWVHVDIAGTAWNAKITGMPSKGGTGFGVRTLKALCSPN